MILQFTLSMPRNNAWNNKWTGEDRFYARVRNFGASKKGVANAKKILQKGSFNYDFGDGWAARITVSHIDANEARKVRSKSIGFFGYEWMIEDIIDHGKIRG